MLFEQSKMAVFLPNFTVRLQFQPVYMLLKCYFDYMFEYNIFKTGILVSFRMTAKVYKNNSTGTANLVAQYAHKTIGSTKMNYKRGLLIFLTGLIVEALAFISVPNLDSVMTVTAIIFLAAVLGARSTDSKNNE